MRIELEEPFVLLWKRAYLRVDKRGRSRVDLVNTSKDRTTISYARYLVSVREGRILNELEEVDHIDGDCSNDSLDNLQILSREEHIKKTQSTRPARAKFSLTCPRCGVNFERYANQMSGRTNIFCSRSCNAKHSRSRGKWLGKTTRA